MKINISKYIFTMLLIACSASSSQQAKTHILSGSSEPKTTVIGHTKLLKTQSSNEFQSIFCGIQDNKGTIWFGTTGEGVYKFDGQLFTQFTKKDGLSSNYVWSILEDKTGNIWFGTTDGICRLDGNKFIPIPIPQNIRPILYDNNYYTEFSTKNTVWSMLEDKSGKIWFGTGDGVYYYDGGNFTRFLNNEYDLVNYNILPKSEVINKDSLKLKLVSSMLEDKNGDIWFASGMLPGSEGISRYDGKMIENFKPKDEGWFRKVIKSKKGNLLLATRHFGILSYDGKSFNDYDQPKELHNGSISTILEDKTGNLWVASDYGKDLGDTLGGLWRSNPTSDKSLEKTFTKISNKEVLFIFEDKNNNIWFGARGVGLFCFDGKTITSFSE